MVAATSSSATLVPGTPSPSMFSLTSAAQRFVNHVEFYRGDADGKPLYEIFVPHQKIIPVVDRQKSCVTGGGLREVFGKALNLPTEFIVMFGRKVDKGKEEPIHKVVDNFAITFPKEHPVEPQIGFKVVAYVNIPNRYDRESEDLIQLAIDKKDLVAAKVGIHKLPYQILNGVWDKQTGAHKSGERLSEADDIIFPDRTCAATNERIPVYAPSTGWLVSPRTMAKSPLTRRSMKQSRNSVGEQMNRAIKRTDAVESDGTGTEDDGALINSSRYSSPRNEAPTPREWKGDQKTMPIYNQWRNKHAEEKCTFWDLYVWNPIITEALLGCERYCWFHRYMDLPRRRTCLHLAAMQGNAHFLRMMLECNSMPDQTINHRDRWRNSVLMAGAMCGQYEVCRLLLDNVKYKRINQENLASLNVLHYAVQMADTRLLELFLEHPRCKSAYANSMQHPGAQILKDYMQRAQSADLWYNRAIPTAPTDKRIADRGTTIMEDEFQRKIERENKGATFRAAYGRKIFERRDRVQNYGDQNIVYGVTEEEARDIEEKMIKDNKAEKEVKEIKAIDIEIYEDPLLEGLFGDKKRKRTGDVNATAMKKAKTGTRAADDDDDDADMGGNSPAMKKSKGRPPSAKTLALKKAASKKPAGKSKPILVVPSKSKAAGKSKAASSGKASSSISLTRKAASKPFFKRKALNFAYDNLGIYAMDVHEVVNVDACSFPEMGEFEYIKESRRYFSGLYAKGLVEFFLNCIPFNVGTAESGIPAGAAERNFVPKAAVFLPPGRTDSKDSKTTSKSSSKDSKTPSKGSESPKGYVQQYGSRIRRRNNKISSDGGTGNISPTKRYGSMIERIDEIIAPEFAFGGGFEANIMNGNDINAFGSLNALNSMNGGFGVSSSSSSSRRPRAVKSPQKSPQGSPRGSPQKAIMGNVSLDYKQPQLGSRSTAEKPNELLSFWRTNTFQEHNFLDNGSTLLHIAARLGHQELCELLINTIKLNNVQDSAETVHSYMQTFFTQFKKPEDKIKRNFGANLDHANRYDTPNMPYDLKNARKYSAGSSGSGGDTLGELNLSNFSHNVTWLYNMARFTKGNNLDTMNGMHVMHIACMTGNYRLASLLLKHSRIPTVDYIDGFGNTVLHLIAENQLVPFPKRKEIVQLLLSDNRRFTKRDARNSLAKKVDYRQYDRGGKMPISM